MKTAHEELKTLVAASPACLAALLVVTAIGVLGSDCDRAFLRVLDEPEKFQLTSQLLRVTFPFLLFVR
jgi:putative peptidoglycan lipid II flippase